MVLEYFDVAGHPGPGHLCVVGRSWQLVKRLLLAQDLFPLRPPETDLLERVVQALLNRAWDHPGWVYALPAHPPDQIQGQDLVVRSKSWWVQCEAISSLALVADSPLFNAPFRARARAARQNSEAFLLEHLIDPEHGGLFSAFPRADPMDPACRKGGPWKDASHETLCLHELLRLPEAQIRANPVAMA
jgi:mannose/cellobiose epimerase-like protein (N-acyl-D-glucosamine 2-epimerase family)